MTAPSSSISYDHQSTVDSASPFRSVKEAIATYGEQFLARKFAHSDQHKADFIREDFVMLPQESGEAVGGGQNFDLSHDGGAGAGAGAGDYDRDDDDVGRYDNDDKEGNGGGKDLNEFVNKLKKLEEELHETKLELKLLKEKESETEVAVASLNAKLHKSMSKIAMMEATEVANMNKYTSKSPMLDRESAVIGSRSNEEGRAKDVNVSKAMEDRPKLDQVLSFGVCEGYFVNSKKVAKKKPIVPLITDICLWKKKSPRPRDEDDLAFLSPSLYSSSMNLP